jgi:hypothetical protein
MAIVGSFLQRVTRTTMDQQGFLAALAALDPLFAVI